ncbi:MAG TPA: beta/gamma crystallin-related protein [Usitatibacter sp.]|nr:beta/gamma crystallin-related protein [Usitatibacter sp.]
MRLNILRAALAAATLVSASAYAAGLTLYTQPDFAGQRHGIQGEESSLASSIQDQAASAVVEFGRWQVCTQPGFKGDCMTLEPGRYSRLDARVFHRIESARPVGGEERYQRYSRYSGYDQASGPLELFAGTGFRGHMMDVDRDMPRLGGRGEGLGISSLVVNEGTWELCTEPRFRGDCETYDRGHYRDIGRLNNQVGSIRRIG